jgi:hypothetical protein
MVKIVRTSRDRNCAKKARLGRDRPGTTRAAASRRSRRRPPQQPTEAVARSSDREATRFVGKC